MENTEKSVGVQTTLLNLARRMFANDLFYLKITWTGNSSDKSPRVKCEEHVRTIALFHAILIMYYPDEKEATVSDFFKTTLCKYAKSNASRKNLRASSARAGHTRAKKSGMDDKVDLIDVFEDENVSGGHASDGGGDTEQNVSDGDTGENNDGNVSSADDTEYPENNAVSSDEDNDNVMSAEKSPAQTPIIVVKPKEKSGRRKKFKRTRSTSIDGRQWKIKKQTQFNDTQ